jgi:hypothetical protein
VATEKQLTTTPMTADNPTITFKVQNLYVAYAPEADLCCYGGCFEEAVNGLAEQLRSLPGKAGQGKGADHNGQRT